MINSATSQQSKKNCKVNFVYLLTFAYAISTFASGILVPIYAFYVQKIGGGILETSWAFGLYSILYGLGTMMIHKMQWTHKYRMHLLWIGWLMWLLSISIYFMVSTLTVLYVSQVIGALGDAIYEPVFDGEFSRQVAADPSSGWAFFNGTTSIFSGIASLLGGVIATVFGFEALLFCVLAVGSISFFLIVYYSRQNGYKVQENTAAE